MRTSIKHSADFYMRYRWKQVVIYPFFAVAGLLVINYYQLNDISVRLLWLTYCLVCFAIELWTTRMMHVRNLENKDLLTLSNNARSYKKLFSIFTVLNYSTVIIIVVGVLLYNKEICTLLNPNAVILASCLALLLMALIGVAEIRYKTKACDDIIAQIEPAETPVDKKKGFGKKQKWLCCAMIVVFLGLDVWALMIDAAFMQQSPRSFCTYIRADDNYSSEGSFEIWEVYSIEKIQDKSRFLGQAALEDNDSLVYRWSADTTESFLYALRKTTESGPIINSAMLGGRPLVKQVKYESYQEGTSIMLLANLMPEASVLYKRMTENAIVRPEPVECAVVIDGKVYQKWRIDGVIESGAFFISTNPDWSKKEVEDFCRRLIKQ